MHITSRKAFLLFIIFFFTFFLLQPYKTFVRAQGYQDPRTTPESIDALNKLLCTLFNCDNKSSPEDTTQLPLPTLTGRPANPNEPTPTNGPSPTPDPNNPNPQPTPTNPPNSSNGFVYYCQGNRDWSGTCAMGTSGCCPTSVAMVVSSLGRNFTPPQVDNVFRSVNARACGRYCTFYSNGRLTVASWIEGLGLKISENLVQPNGNLNSNTAKQYLDRGCYILAASNWVDGQQFKCGQSCQPNEVYFGHVYAIDQVEGTQMHVRDPSNCYYGPGNESSNFQWRNTSIVDFAVAVCQPT